MEKVMIWVSVLKGYLKCATQVHWFCIWVFTLEQEFSLGLNKFRPRGQFSLTFLSGLRP